MKDNFFHRLGNAIEALKTTAHEPEVKQPAEEVTTESGLPKYENPPPPPEAVTSIWTGDDVPGYTRLGVISYTGEKNEGEAGPLINYRVDHEALSIRSNAAYLDSELAQTVIGKYKTWLIGDGLSHKCEPPVDILKEEGITISPEEFSKSVESRFKLFKKSRTSDYAGMDNLDILAGSALVTSLVSGDVLLLLRLDENNRVSVQLIDGCHIKNPYDFTYNYKLKNGNRLCHGVEINAQGQHVRYHVRNSDGTFNTIEARSEENGLIMARLIYGMKYRLDNVRGLPLLAACLETIKQMDRYKSAMLGNAEELAKHVYQIVHQEFSDGTNPMMSKMLEQSGFNSGTNEAKLDAEGKKVARKFKATFNKEAFNMPRGSKLEAIQNKNTLYFGDFFNVNINLVCATLQMPPNVAMSKYDDNFSASRAGLKDWENVMNVKRPDFGYQYYQTVYEFWLEVQILLNKIKAPGYLIAKAQNNIDVLESYRKARWTGSQVPHIDPVKEVKAELMKLGKGAEYIPLTTVERATEVLNGGDSKENIRQFATELKLCKDSEIIPEIVPPDEKQDNGKTTRKTEKKDT